MKRYLTILSALVAATICFFTVSLAQDAPATPADSAAGSRWARVDFTQYCGRTVGELLDTLGNDYREYYIIEDPKYIFAGYAFIYEFGAIEFWSSNFKYCSRELIGGVKASCDVNVFRKESIRHMTIYIGKDSSAIMPVLGSDTSVRKGFQINYLEYLGATIDSLLRGIGLPCRKSWVRSLWRRSCSVTLEYPNNVQIEAYVDRSVYISPDSVIALGISDYILQQRIGSMEIEIPCPVQYGVRNKISREGSSISPLDNSMKNARSFIEKHRAIIDSLIARTKRYNENKKASDIGTLVIRRWQDDTSSYRYFTDIGGRYADGINANTFVPSGYIEATVHTHIDCAEPSPIDIQALARGLLGHVVIIVGTKDNSMSILRCSDVKALRSYVYTNSREAIASKLRGLTNQDQPCEQRADLLRKYFREENTGIEYMYVKDWRKWIK